MDTSLRLHERCLSRPLFHTRGWSGPGERDRLIQCGGWHPATLRRAHRRNEPANSQRSGAVVNSPKSSRIFQSATGFLLLSIALTFLDHRAHSGDFKFRPDRYGGEISYEYVYPEPIRNIVRVLMVLSWVSVVAQYVWFGIERRRALNCPALRRVCSRCGYDLRATPSRCPECGTLAIAPNTSQQ